MLAYALARAGQPAEGVTVLRKLLELHPTNADAWHNLGNLLRAQRDLEGAARAFKRAALLRPANVDAEVNAGYVLVQLGRFDEAEEQIRAALRRFPDEPDLWVNLAQVQRAMRRWDAAIATLGRCVAQAPHNAGYRITRSLALRDAGHGERALAELGSVIDAQPQNGEARFARAQLLLSLGEYGAGWLDYLWRPDRIRWLAARAKPAGTPAPPLESLRGRRVVVHGEQGLGDTLFFLRFLPRLAEAAASLDFAVDPRLASILPWTWKPASRGAPDVELLVGDLPAIFNAGPTPSLSLASEARLAARLAACGPPPYIGLTWQAGLRWEEMDSPGQLSKLVPPAALGAALARTSNTLVSLQRASRPEELALVSAGAKRPVHDFSWVNDDLADALALLASLDDYIAVSNTNVHLNEALGKRTRVLVTRPAEWRWTDDRPDSPWFAHAVLYRQARDGAWDAALQRLAEDMK